MKAHFLNQSKENTNDPVFCGKNVALNKTVREFVQTNVCKKTLLPRYL